MARFSKLYIGEGKTFDISKFSPEVQKAIDQGIADAWLDFADLKKHIEAGEVSSGDAFGTRAYLKNNYAYRMAAAVLGIWVIRLLKLFIQAITPILMERSWMVLIDIRYILAQMNCHLSMPSGR